MLRKCDRFQGDRRRCKSPSLTRTVSRADRILRKSTRLIGQSERRQYPEVAPRVGQRRIKNSAFLGGIRPLFGLFRTVSNREMVPRKGLEPSRLATHRPERCASTNSATWARRGQLEAGPAAVNAVFSRRDRRCPGAGDHGKAAVLSRLHLGARTGYEARRSRAHAGHRVRTRQAKQGAQERWRSTRARQ